MMQGCKASVHLDINGTPKGSQMKCQWPWKQKRFLRNLPFGNLKSFEQYLPNTQPVSGTVLSSLQALFHWIFTTTSRQSLLNILVLQIQTVRWKSDRRYLRFGKWKSQDLNLEFPDSKNVLLRITTHSLTTLRVYLKFGFAHCSL